MSGREGEEASRREGEEVARREGEEVARREGEEASGREGEEVARELLNLVLEEVWSCTKWDIASRGGQRGGSLGPHFNVCAVIRELHPSRVLTCFSWRQGRAEILHLKCVEQQASGYCGHYALYFTLCCLECCFAEQLSDCEGFLLETSHIGAFWRRYWKSIGVLLEHVKKNGKDSWWPWVAEHVLSGDMERSYLAYILASDTHVQTLVGGQNIVVIHYAYGCIQDTESQVCAAQARITMFREAPAPAHLVFILGVTNHWVTLLATKSGPGEQDRTSTVLGSDERERSGGEKISLIYLDSNNVPVLGASDADILVLVHKKEKERVQRKGKGWSEWKRGVIYQAFVDQRALVSMLADCLCDNADLRGELLRVSWSRMLDSYDQNVFARLSSSEDTGLYVALLLHWLEGQYHPQTLRDTHLGMLHRLGPGWLGQGVRERVQLWVEHCRRILEGYTTGLTLVDLFVSVVDKTASLA